MGAQLNFGTCAGSDAYLCNAPLLCLFLQFAPASRAADTPSYKVRHWRSGANYDTPARLCVIYQTSIYNCKVLKMDFSNTKVIDWLNS